MKRLWNIISFIALVNLLSLGLFVAWLAQSGRLNVARISRIHDLLATTIAAEQAAAEEQAQQAAREQAEAAERARQANPPLPSTAQVQNASLTRDQTDAALARVGEETTRLRGQLDARAAELDQREQDFRTARAEWLASIEAEKQRRTDEQFLQTVRQYESAPAKIAREWMLELVDDGKQEQVVAYLDAMNPRAASKILREFKTEKEAALATELLEKLRTFGLEAVLAEESGNDDAPSDAE
jgi:colicin import membrane protein